MSRGEIIKFLILRSIGNFLVLFALFGVFATFGPALAEETRFRISQARGVRYRIEDVPPRGSPSLRLRPAKSDLAGLRSGRVGHPRGETKEHLRGGESLFASLGGPKEQVLIPKDTQFSIVILKIGASAKVFPNVDASDEDAFLPILQEGVAHARGTVFPGMKGNIYLFAHSVDTFWNVGRYNAVFYLIKDLEKGDDIVVFFEGRRHNYTVTETKIVEPEDVAYLTQGQQKKDEVLILQSCWPPGTTWKRLIVLATPK